MSLENILQFIRIYLIYISSQLFIQKGIQSSFGIKIYIYFAFICTQWAFVVLYINVYYDAIGNCFYYTSNCIIIVIFCFKTQNTIKIEQGELYTKLIKRLWILFKCGFHTDARFYLMTH